MNSPTNLTISEIRFNTTLLTALSDDMFNRLLPAVAVLIAVMAVGTIGNSIICYIFISKLRPSGQNYLLLSLGVFDLMSCSIGVPSEIFDIRHYYMYESQIGCKTMRFLTMLPTLASVLVLLVIAADRYRKICKPLHRQIHRCHVRIALVITVVVALFLSIPALSIYGHRILSTPFPDEFGYDCSISETHRSKHYHVMYDGLFCALFVVCTVALVVIYVRIWRETKRHINYIKSHAMFSSGLFDNKSNTSSANYDESVSTSRRNSDVCFFMNRIVVHRCYTCFRRKSRRESESHPGVTDTLVPMVTPVITLTNRDFGITEGAVHESYCQCLQVDGDVADGETSNQTFQLGVINKQAGISANTLSGCLLNSKDAINFEEPEGTRIFKDDRHICDHVCDRNLTLSDNNQPERCLYSLQTKHESNDVELSTRDNLNCENHVYNQPTTAFISDINRPDESEFGSVLSNLTSLDVNSTCNNNYNADIHRPPGPLNQRNGCDYDYTECYGRQNSDKILLQTEETKQSVESAEHAHPTHICENFPSMMQCLSHSFNTQHSDISEQSSYASQESSWNDIENIELHGSDSKRVSFSATLDDFEYSRPVVTALETPEIDCHKHLQRRRSDQSLLSAKRSKKALRSTRTTIVAFVITIGFILSYLPYLILAILRSVKDDYAQQFDDVSLNVYNIFLRSYFANNVINIFVYSYMHLEFRTQLSLLWRRCTCRTASSHSMPAK